MAGEQATLSSHAGDFVLVFSPFLSNHGFKLGVIETEIIGSLPLLPGVCLCVCSLGMQCDGSKAKGCCLTGGKVWFIHLPREQGAALP